MNKLSDRVRANSEAAPWVIDEIEQYESVLHQALDAMLRVQPQVRGAIPQQDIEDAIDAIERRLK